jgi:hypothetical protein
MRCFYHAERDAVGICNSCHRGLCHDCIADVPPSIACRGKCENEVSALNVMRERGKTAYQKTATAYQRSAIALLLMGIFFLVIGILPTPGRNPCYGTLLALPLGLFLTLWASYFQYRSARQLSQVK